MSTPVANEPRARRRKAYALSVGLHVASVLLLSAGTWIPAVMALFALHQRNASSQPTKVILLAPPSGRPAPVKSVETNPRGRSGEFVTGAPAVDDSTEIAWNPDYGRQLLPVLRAHGGLIVFVDPLDRTRPIAAFGPDGTRISKPPRLDHYLRLRMRDPSWWPQVERLCAQADPERAMEVMAVFPPEFRNTLTAAVTLRLDESKLSGRVAWLSLSLDASRPAGVVVRDIKVISSRGSMVHPEAEPLRHSGCADGSSCWYGTSEET